MDTRRTRATLLPAFIILLVTACDSSSGGKKTTDIFTPQGAVVAPGPSGNGGSGPSKPTRTLCVHILQCYDGCDEDDDACFDACLNDATPAAQAAFGKLEDCAEDAGCRDVACAKSACPTEYAVCEGRAG